MSIIFDKSYFDIFATLACGQVFRYKIRQDYSEIFSGAHIALLKTKQDCVIIDCDDESYFIHYFDLARDYSSIVKALSSYNELTDAVNYGKGIRILNGLPLEVLISFILSSNNHIPRIRGLIDKMCVDLGENMGEYYAFPTIEALSSVGEDYFNRIGCGYRDKYLSKTIQIIKTKQIDLDTIYSLDEEAGANTLMKLSGVGRKVADCILLFAYHKTSLFPVDTWIVKYFNACYGSCLNINTIRERLTNLYGNLAGYAQQYIFYYRRELAGIKV